MSCDHEANRVGLNHVEVEAASSKQFEALIRAWQLRNVGRLDAGLLGWLNDVYQDKKKAEQDRALWVRELTHEELRPRKGRPPKRLLQTPPGT